MAGEPLRPGSFRPREVTTLAAMSRSMFAQKRQNVMKTTPVQLCQLCLQLKMKREWPLQVDNDA